MKQSTQVGYIFLDSKCNLSIFWCRKRNIARHSRLSLCVLGQGRPSPRLVTRVRIRLTPECVGKNTHRTTCCSNVFNFSTRNPVVDRPTAHANQFARFHDRNGFSVNNHRFTLYLQTRNFEFNKGKRLKTATCLYPTTNCVSAPNVVTCRPDLFCIGS